MNKKLKQLLRDTISLNSDSLVSKFKHENGFRIFIKASELNPNDPLNEEVWDEDIDIKIFKEMYYGCENKTVYILKVNDDKIKKYKDGEYLYKMLKNKYKNKKVDQNKLKISRIISKLDK
jgi:hypothetical protein